MRHCPHLCKILWLFCILTCTFAYAKPEKESFPIIGSVSTVLSFNHSNFVSEDQSADADKYGLPTSSGFGWVNSRLVTSLSYILPTTKGQSPIYISGGIGFSRAIKESFSRAGLNTVQPKQFVINDLGVNLGWGLPGFNKISKSLNGNVGLGITAPFSRVSRSTGLVTSFNPSLSISYLTPIRVVVQFTGFGGYNILEKPTIQVDCRVSPDYCRISGQDLGAPNQLINYGGNLAVQIPLGASGFRFGMGYTISAGMGAVKFPERESDEYASTYSQSENQYSRPGHSTSFQLIFGFNRAGSAAQQALNESLEGDKKKTKKSKEPSFLSRLNFVLAMSTRQALYSSDNKRITVPIFDFETDNYSRTSYAFVVRVAL